MTDTADEVLKPVELNAAGVEIGAQASLDDIRAMEALQEKQKSKSK